MCVCVCINLLFFLVIQHSSPLMFSKKDVETSPNIQLSFLVHKPSTGHFIHIHPKFQRANLCGAVHLSQIKERLGWAASPAQSLARGPRVGNGPECERALPPPFLSVTALLWGQIFLLPSQELQNSSQGLLKIGCYYFLVWVFFVHVSACQK